MPIFFITVSEREFVFAQIEYTSANPSVPNANSRLSFAASVAYPTPQADRFSRQPISTQGVNGLSYV